MALSEFVALETAYRALVELDAPARARALAWLTDALATPGVLPQDHSPAAAVETAGDQPPAAANAAPRARRQARPAASPAVETKPSRAMIRAASK